MKREQEAASFLGNPLLRGLVAWFEWSGSAQIPSEQVVLEECCKLSERALAYFISQCAKIGSVTWARLLRRFISGILGNIKAKETLDTILNHLNTISTGNIIASIICDLIEGGDVDLTLHDPFLDSLVAAIHQV